MTAPAYRMQPSVSSSLTVTSPTFPEVAFTVCVRMTNGFSSAISGRVTVPPVAAAISRARPSCERRSGGFGSTSLTAGEGAADGAERGETVEADVRRAAHDIDQTSSAGIDLSDPEVIRVWMARGF